MSKNIISFLGIALTVGITGFISLKLIKDKPTPKKAVKQEKVISIKAGKVEFTDVKNDQSFHGRVNAAQTFILSSEVAGRIVQTNVRLKEGNTFRKGQSLVHVFDEDVKATLKSNKSSFMNTVASILADIKIDYNDEYQKWYDFFTSVKIDKPLPELPKINSDQERFFLASRNVITEYFMIQQAEINLAKYKVYAPFNGTFKTVRLEAGSIVSPGSEIGVISRTDVLEVVVEVEPLNAKWINKGDKVMVKTESRIPETIQGTVIRKSKIVDPQSQTIKIYVNIHPNSQSEIYEGQFVEVTFNGETIKDVIELPREAVMEGKYVFTVENNALAKKEIVVIKTNHDSYFIQGLNQNDILVEESIFNGKEGAKVNIRG
ncbi:HlyD family efflux transporter periplasmic adaptor subunit [Flammeovirga yaeyamensis]|uniref:HlyD family efflux transporter periplasmic adaptor subunit n=1 Tax=Flammeovirga yaeyamensis TaxID=367791 RepID=A0AAX1N2L6_9BACT|nr:HlyD family efflux transporter periplasmic adaptor subunit [Flammeovirga yaeyamensis]MBB3700851.1 multidrug efflux pump subunit AcrA (membrane-fusion protein) [Flammeovirga yaeyamensis]NMF37959.1 HlyD family efflux transporter periplasmic adaptor subunit [Flammeovirga yaeyamensis]QWG00611.1 HlyD family efflux transporter periplasmic adaptor subunit [Flammeovirga yaeyamensis]